MFLGVVLAPAQGTFTVLFSFNGSDGYEPDAGVIQDPAGNLYGTTQYAGDLSCGDGEGCGLVFGLNTSGTETVLHGFAGNGDGTIPFTPVARDSAGNFYGTTQDGGYGWGVVYKIDTAGNETVLYSFTGGSDGCVPMQGLLVHTSDTLFGTTYGYGCGSGYGTIFKIDSAGKFTLLHTFTGDFSDGANPFFGHLAMGKSGNLYGLTQGGGRWGWGVLYELSRSGKFKVLHSFRGGANDGCYPDGSVLQDGIGNFYGTTARCGSNNIGIIWKVNKQGKEIILHNFTGYPSDGAFPVAGLARDSQGNLYGVATGGGAHGGGALYELSASGALTLLHSFDGTDGDLPQGELLRTADGTFFGTASGGGGTENICVGGCGTVWSYVP
jgi:uncharacterized repeat protein (TIGR03803 family)